MSALTEDRCLSLTKNAALWALQIVTAVAFLAAGIASLAGQPMIVETFDKIGVGQWFRYVTGGIEIASAILLMIPRLTPVGAALLLFTMIGAVLTHLTLIGGSPVPALVLLCLVAIILWGRFETLEAGLLKFFTPARTKPADVAMSPERRAATTQGR